MKHKIQIEVERNKKGFLGITRKVKEKKTVVVDDKTYRKLKAQEKRNGKNRPYSLEEMMFYDDMFGD
jgi:hypothetical protein